MDGTYSPQISFDLSTFEQSPRTREEAIERGSARYFTGVPCKKGHFSDRFVSGGCVRCRMDMRQRPENKARRNALMRIRRASEPPKVKRKPREFVYVAEFDGLPRSRREAIELGVSSYFTGKPCKNGHLEKRNVKGGCRGCKRDQKKTPEARKKKRKKEKLKRRTPEGRIKYLAQRARRFERIRADPDRYESHKKRKREKRKAYKLTPAGRMKERIRNARKEKRLSIATPKWCEMRAIDQFRAACPEGHHVDHIIPLNGVNVCGLNIIDNLQYLPAQENLFKSNKIDPATLEAVVCVLPEYRSYVSPQSAGAFSGVLRFDPEDDKMKQTP